MKKTRKQLSLSTKHRPYHTTEPSDMWYSMKTLWYEMISKNSFVFAVWCCVHLCEFKGIARFFSLLETPQKSYIYVYQMMSIENRFAQHVFEQESCYTVFPSHWKMGNHRNVSTRTWKQVRRFCWTIFKFVRNWIICVLSYFVFLQQCCPPWKKWR